MGSDRGHTYVGPTCASKNVYNYQGLSQEKALELYVFYNSAGFNSRVERVTPAP